MTPVLSKRGVHPFSFRPGNGLQMKKLGVSPEIMHPNFASSDSSYHRLNYHYFMSYFYSCSKKNFLLLHG